MHGKQFAIIIGVKQKGGFVLHSGIAVMENLNINEQNKSIETEPIYDRAELQAI